MLQALRAVTVAFRHLLAEIQVAGDLPRMTANELLPGRGVKNGQGLRLNATAKT